MCMPECVLTFSFQWRIPMMTRMNTHTPIKAMAVSSTLLLGVRYNLALQLKRKEKFRILNINIFTYLSLLLKSMGFLLHFLPVEDSECVRLCHREQKIEVCWQPCKCYVVLVRCV